MGWQKRIKKQALKKLLALADLIDMTNFNTIQVLKCHYCNETTTGIPAKLKGNTRRRHAWLSNGYDDGDKHAHYALCPDHQSLEEIEGAKKWAYDQVKTGQYALI